MIRIPFDTDRISHGHLIHPLELAHLIHFWDNRQHFQHHQQTALEAVSQNLRRLSPLVAELVNNMDPTHPFPHMAPQIQGMLATLRQGLDRRLQDTNEVFQPIPTPYIPYDACGRTRGPQDCYPAPPLRKHAFPRSRSAPPTIHRKRQHLPWAHIQTTNSVMSHLDFPRTLPCKCKVERLRLGWG